LQFITALITSADKTVWYYPLLFSEIEVTTVPVFRDDVYCNSESPNDIFVMKSSFLENVDNQNGTHQYKGIKRAHLQFKATIDGKIDF